MLKSLADEGKESAVAFLKRAVRWFSQFGITIKRVLTEQRLLVIAQKLWRITCERLQVQVKKTPPLSAANERQGRAFYFRR